MGKGTGKRTGRWLAGVGAVLVVALGTGLGVAFGGTAGADSHGHGRGRDPQASGVDGRDLAVLPGTDYLALGDSVAFGYREPTTVPAPNYQDAASFVGYPEDVAAALHLKVTNASCPGETSSSFIDASAESNGCENHVSSTGQVEPGGYRTLYPLHVAYQGSQLAFALHFLKTHRDTRLVTLAIGANDGFICQDTTPDHCTTPSELDPVLARITKNVGIILRDIRDEAHYRGQIVIVNYYSLDSANPLDNAATAALNGAMDAGAKPYDVEIAHGHALFAADSTYSKDDECTAGLLTQLSTGGCGVHPSPAGQSVLAQAVEEAVHL
jgi:lysophospholipase L1-like esterase